MKKQITIKRINRQQKTSKAGKPFTSVGLLVAGKQGDMWVNGFDGPVVSTWKEGDTVTVEIYKDDYGWKFKAPRVEELVLDALAEIRSIVLEISSHKNQAGKELPSPGEPPPISDEHQPYEEEEEIPF